MSFTTPPPHPPNPSLSFLLFGDCLQTLKPLHELFMLSICLEISFTSRVGKESWVNELRQTLKCGLGWENHREVPVRVEEVGRLDLRNLTF